MQGMAKTKLSVTLDPAKVSLAQELTGTTTISELLDVALGRLVETELDRRHVAGYQRTPQTATDAAWAELERDPMGIADDTDWAALYDESSEGFDNLQLLSRSRLIRRIGALSPAKLAEACRALGHAVSC